MVRPAERRFTLADTWLLNNRINLKLLENLTGEQLALQPNPKARSVGDQFAHLHNVRVAWLEAMTRAKIEKIEKGCVARDRIAEFLIRSAGAVGEVFTEAETTGTLKGYKRGPAAFLGYLIAHEGHHRGQIVLHLKYAKMPVDKVLGFALWEWEKI
jgi:uncharacterized damage-inducible protein DinB